MHLHGIAAPDAAKKGIYVGLSTGPVYGYKYNESRNGPAICTQYSNTYNAVNDIAVDGEGNLMVPEGGTRSILVFKGPNMCGPSAGTISDPYGDDAEVASNNALTGMIAVGNIFGNSGGKPSISRCTLSRGCKSYLTNSNFSEELLGVAMDKSGDCWASGYGNDAANLTYFAGCKGAGVYATGWLNPAAGGLDVDSQGNLVSISGSFGTGGSVGHIYVYSGCKPKCKIIGAATAMEGGSIYGHLNKKSTMFAAGDWNYQQVDIYSYSPKHIAYLYSFNNGLGQPPAGLGQPPLPLFGSVHGYVYTATYGPGS